MTIIPSVLQHIRWLCLSGTATSLTKRVYASRSPSTKASVDGQEVESPGELGMFPLELLLSLHLSLDVLSEALQRTWGSFGALPAHRQVAFFNKQTRSLGQSTE